MQALNVARGGSLIQDIVSQTEGSHKHEQEPPHNRHAHSIVVERGSFLSDLPAAADADLPLRVNSSHHQSVARLGRDLRVSARAKDGIIEAIEDTRPGRFAVGVQWHPEMTTGVDEISFQIFEAFVGRCAAASESGNFASRGA
jgi:putative glutamine amidotransferase